MCLLACSQLPSVFQSSNLIGWVRANLGQCRICMHIVELTNRIKLWKALWNSSSCPPSRHISICNGESIFDKWVYRPYITHRSHASQTVLSSQYSPTQKRDCALWWVCSWSLLTVLSIFKYQYLTDMMLNIRPIAQQLSQLKHWKVREWTGLVRAPFFAWELTKSLYEQLFLDWVPIMSLTWKVYNLISIAMKLNLPMVTMEKACDGLVDKTYSNEVEPAYGDHGESMWWSGGQD